MSTEVVVNTDFTVNKIHEAISIFPLGSTGDVLINICVRTELGQEWNRMLDGLWYLCSSVVPYNYHVLIIHVALFIQIHQSLVKQWPRSQVVWFALLRVYRCPAYYEKIQSGCFVGMNYFSHWGWNDQGTSQEIGLVWDYRLGEVTQLSEVAGLAISVL